MAGEFEMHGTEVETRAAALLRSDPEFTVPLGRLHGRLTADLGRAAGTQAELQERLRRRPDLFLLLDAPDQTWNAESWSPEAREEYRTALRQLGLDPGPRVGLVRVPETSDPTRPAYGTEAVLRRIESSLLDLWCADPADPSIQRDLNEAVTRMRELRDALASAHEADPPTPG